MSEIKQQEVELNRPQVPPDAELDALDRHLREVASKNGEFHITCATMVEAADAITAIRQQLHATRVELLDASRRKLEYLKRKDELERAEAERDALRKEIEALREDAERYRWIEPLATSYTYSKSNGGGTVWQINCGVGASETNMNVAVDAARGK